MSSDTLATIGPAIARNLPGWKYHYHVLQGDTWGQSMLLPIEAGTWHRGEMAIHLHADTYKKRINISGAYPFRSEGGEWSHCTPGDVYVDGKRLESPSISVGIGIDPKKIAADINRRFLTDYRDVYVQCVAHLDRNVTGRNAQMAMAQEFAKIMRDKTTNAHASWYGKDCYGHCDVNWGGDTATMELRGDVRILKAALEAAVKAGALKK